MNKKFLNKKVFILFLLFFFTCIPLKANNNAEDYNLKYSDYITSEAYKNEYDQPKMEINYKPTKQIDFDAYAEKFVNIINEGSSKLKGTSYIVLFFLAGIQFIVDLAEKVTAKKYDEIFTALFRRIIIFGFYSVLLDKLYSGELLTIAKEIAYTTTSFLSGERNLQGMNTIYSFKEVITTALWEIIDKLWGLSDIVPAIFLKDLITTIGILIFIFSIHIGFFAIMFDLFKIMISFVLCLNLSGIFIPLGILNITKPFYNSGKLISLMINFIVKITCINVFALVGFKALTQSNILKSDVFQSDSLTSLLQSDLVIILIIIFTIVSLLKKIDISF